MKQRVRSLGCLARLSEYSESSLILRFFTRDLGAVSVLAKGIRRAQTRNQLMALGEYELNLYPPTESGLYLLGEISSIKERDLSAGPQHWARCLIHIWIFYRLAKAAPSCSGGDFY